jgi:hypothetical protein
LDIELFTNKNLDVMKKVKCKLIFHGSCKEHDMGFFESITAAKKYVERVSYLWKKPYSIIRIK